MAQGSTVEVWSTVALREAFNVLMPQFEQATGYKADVRWVPTVDLMNRLKAGEPTDLVIATRRNLDELIRAGAIDADRVVPLVSSVVAMAVRAGAQKPDISSAAALKRALLAASSIAYSLGPSGVHMAALVERFGIGDAVKAKTRITKGEPVGAALARGEVQLGFQQLSELLPVAGIDIVGPLPPDAQEVSVFTAGLHVKARDPEAAMALARFVTAASAHATLRKAGLEPV
jgi:molybdate transport system substrate-binding protein